MQEATNAPGVTGYNHGAESAQTSQDLSDAVMGAATRNTAEVGLNAMQYCSDMQAHATNQLLAAQQQTNLPSSGEVRNGANKAAEAFRSDGSVGKQFNRM